MKDRPKTIELLPIAESGAVDLGAALPPPLAESCAGMVGFYQAVGFHPPWIGYIAAEDGRPVGLGAFKGPPRDHRVEIAYFTLPQLEGRGLATATAAALVRIARAADPSLIVAAQTLPARGASTALLEKLGFSHHGVVQHPEDGEVWEWRL